MALSRDDIKAFFELNDIPTSPQYDAFIDGVPNIHDDYNDEPAFSRRIKVALTAAQIRTLNSAPITVIPAPGAGFAIEVLAFSARLIFVGPQFSTNQPLQLTTDTATLPQRILTNLLFSTANSFYRSNGFTTFLFDQTFLVDNEELILNIPADLAAGGSSVDCYITFQIITL